MVAFITGNGLKTVEAVQHLANPVNINATVSSFEESIDVEATVGSKSASS